MNCPYCDEQMAKYDIGDLWTCNECGVKRDADYEGTLIWSWKNYTEGNAVGRGKWYPVPKYTLLIVKECEEP